MSNHSAVIFDRDGVLADFDYVGAKKYFNNLPISLYELRLRWQNWGEIYGFPSCLEQEEEFFDMFWNNLGDELQIPDRDLDKFREFNYADYLLLFPDVKNTLFWLRSKGFRIGVLTNFTLASVEMSLKTLGIWEYVDVACGATIIGVAKPDPKAYKIVMEKLNADPRKTVFFDDEVKHVVGARYAGITNAFFVNRSASNHDFLNREIMDLSAIKDIIKRINKN
jgi:putative hydrolase of the HAD superfamily